MSHLQTHRGCAVLLLLCTVLSLLATCTDAVSLRMMTASCGSRIPLDSLYPVESWWSLRDLMDWRNTSSTLGLTFGDTRDLSPGLLTAMERVTGMSGRHLTLFELDASLWWSATTSCTISWEPRDVLYVDTQITAASVAVVPYASELDCPVHVASFRHGSSEPYVVPALPTTAVMLNITASVQQTTLYAEETLWPVHLLVGPRCKAYVLLAINREVSLEEWWTWIPATVYTAVVAPISFFTAVTRKKVSASSFAFLLGTMFVGYLGSSIGLMVALAGWQVTSGRFFPFPDSVTLYVCLWIGYAALMPLLLYRHPCRRMLFNAVVRSLIYGLFVAQVVAYWTLGFVAIASVGLALILVVNGVLIFLYARFVSLLATSKDMEDELRSMPMSWLAPFSPFVPSVLLYADLFFVHHAPPVHVLDLRLRDMVELFNVQSAIPFMLLLESGAVALLVAATVRQPTFLVALFILLMVVAWHVLWTLEQYVAARQHWKIEQQPGRRLLWPAIHSLIDKHNVEVYKKNALAASVPSQGLDHHTGEHQRISAAAGRDAGPPHHRSASNGPSAYYHAAHHHPGAHATAGGGSSRGSTAQYTPREGEQPRHLAAPQGNNTNNAVSGRAHDAEPLHRPQRPGLGHHQRVLSQSSYLGQQPDAPEDYPPRYHNASVRSNSNAVEAPLPRLHPQQQPVGGGDASWYDQQQPPSLSYGPSGQQPLDDGLPEDNYNMEGAMQRFDGGGGRHPPPATWQDRNQLPAGSIPYVDRSPQNH